MLTLLTEAQGCSIFPANECSPGGNDFILSLAAKVILYVYIQT